MKFKIIVAGLLSLAVTTPACAQSVGEDMRCFILSQFFAKSAKDDKGRMVANESAIFYLGRLDGRAAPAAIMTALHAQIDPKSAGPLMTACAQHLGHAELAMQAAFKTLAPPAKH